MCGCMDGLMDECMGGWVDGYMDGWRGGRTDGRMIDVGMDEWAGRSM